MATFVHVSDIHFGQERGGEVYVHADVKKRVIEDAARVVGALPRGRADGVLVTGDIAYAGKRGQYQAAAEWLDSLAAAVKCEKTSVQVVPGNHDIDRDEISQATDHLLKLIEDGGEAALDKIIANDNDRELFYRRFSAYRPFAEGYDCPLDRDGTLVRSRRIELAPSRALNFVGLNSALVCAKNDAEGKLLLGAKQRVLPRIEGEELVVLAHHPLKWLLDSEDAKLYVRNRARVFISGHEHDPRVQVDQVRADCDLLMIASGATVPPASEKGYTYTYNVLEFAWNDERKSLAVTVHPRAWKNEAKDFFAAPEQLEGQGPTFHLKCGELPAPAVTPSQTIVTQEKLLDPAGDANRWAKEERVPDEYPLLLLKYFRDLRPGQRLRALVRLGALPDDWDEPLTHTMERRILDGLARNGRLQDLQNAINEFVPNTSNGNGGEE